MKEQKILVVDDQYGVRSLLMVALNRYQVQEAISGQQALEIAAKWEPDLIIIDMKMPGLNGIDTISKINELGINPSILLMTAYNDNEINTGNVKISGFISKPFDLDKLIDLVDSILS